MKTRPRRTAFTLIELLVVMGIIALLVALLFPAIGAARQAANRARAEQEAKSIETAIKSYLNEYGKYPLQNASTADKEYTGGDYSALIATLRGLDTTNNARRIVFLEAAEGSVTNNVMLDPWDLAYKVKADWNFDNAVQPTSYASNLVGRTVAVWSAGPDRKSGNATEQQDDVVSWGK